MRVSGGLFTYEVEDPYHLRLKRWAPGAINFARRRVAKRLLQGREAAAVTITTDELMAIVERQGYVCKLSGLRLWSVAFSPTLPTLDRVKNDGPYSAGNVRVVCLGLNGLRGNGSDADMYRMAEALLATRAKRKRVIQK